MALATHGILSLFSFVTGIRSGIRTSGRLSAPWMTTPVCLLEAVLFGIGIHVFRTILSQPVSKAARGAISILISSTKVQFAGRLYHGLARPDR